MKFSAITKFFGLKTTPPSHGINLEDAANSKNINYEATFQFSAEKGYSLYGNKHSADGGSIIRIKAISRNDSRWVVVRVRDDETNSHLEWLNKVDTTNNSEGEWETLLPDLTTGKIPLIEVFNSYITGTTPTDFNQMIFSNGAESFSLWNISFGTVASNTDTTVTLNAVTGYTTLAELGFDATGTVIINGTEYAYTGLSTLTFTGVTPSPNGIDQSQTTQNATQAFGESDATEKVWYIAQSFVAGDTSIDGVKLYKTANTGTPYQPLGTFYFGIQADVDGSPSGSNLKVKAMNTATYDALPVGEYTVNFASSLTLVAGTTYWIMVRFDSGTAFDHPNLGVNSAGGYASGAVKGWNTTDGWTSIADIDFYFKTFNSDDAVVAGDVLVQKVVTNTDSPAANRNNHTIHNHENQIFIGSEEDEEVYGSKNDNYTDFTFSSPRSAGEGVLLTLTDTTRGFASLGKYLLIGSGRSTIFRTEYQQIAVGAAITESLQVKKLDVGVDQGFLNQESIIPVGNTLIYLTNEVSCRQISNPDDLTGIKPKTLSNPIKPDFDAENWWDSNYNPSAFGTWYKNMVIFTAPQASHMYILSFVEDADGKLFRFWNPPQTFPAGAMSIYDLEDGNGALLYGHSNAVPETYLLFDGASDGQYADMEVKEKLPIDAKAVFAYDDSGKRAVLKNFDEFYVEGEITPNTTDLILGINYDYDGVAGKVEKTIDGSDEDILEGAVGFNSLAQQSLAVNPLGGLLNPPTNARKFRIALEMAKIDYFTKQAIFSTNDVDRYWAILANGCNVQLSKRRPIHIKK